LTIQLPPWIGVPLSLLICAVALWKGGLEERVTASGFLICFAITALLRDTTWPHIQKAVFASDVAYFILLLVIALRTYRYWPLTAAGFQLLAVMTHVAKMIDNGMGQWAYVTAGVIWTYLLLIALGVGVWNCWRDKVGGRPPSATGSEGARARRRSV
jgi:hypothetical protein